MCVLLIRETSLACPVAKNTQVPDTRVDPVHITATATCWICLFTNLLLFHGRNGRRKELVRTMFFRDGLKTGIAMHGQGDSTICRWRLGVQTQPHTKLLLHIMPTAQMQQQNQQLPTGIIPNDLAPSRQVPIT